MDKRPLCVVLGVLILLILIFQERLSSLPEQEAQGEEKVLQCQVKEICGQGLKRSLTVSDVTEEETPFCQCMKIYQPKGAGLFSGLKIGNIITVKGKLFSFSHPGNPGQFDEFQYYQDLGISYSFYAQSVEITDHTYKRTEQFLAELRTTLYQGIMSCLPEEEGGIIAAMILGEKCALTEEIRTLYQENGIAHIFAISGLHISLIGAGIFFLLRRYVMPMKPAALMTAILLLLYGELTGFSLSAQRAILMMLCILAARFLGRRYDLYCALALSAIIQLGVCPTVIFQAGFLLSYGTVLGIALFVQRFQGVVVKRKTVWQVFLGSLGIGLVTLPVILFFYYEFNPYSTLVNLVVLPFVSVLILLSVTGSLCASVYGMAGRFLFGVVHFILGFYYRIGEMILALPYATVITGKPAFWQIAAYYLLVTLWVYVDYVMEKKCLERDQNRYKRRSFQTGILALAVWVLLFTWPGNTELTITNLDVGQGDCACIRIGDKTILIDGGSSDVDQVGKYRISKYLKYYGIQTLDYIFISHSDSDHVNGIMEVVQEQRHMGLCIGTIILPEIGKTDEAYDQLEQICLDNEVIVKKMGRGDRLCIGQMELQCLHPYKEYDWQVENDYSLVLLLSYGEFQGLFTGDLEQTGEKEILGQMADVDYLKVGHHGSAGASGEEFLGRLRPEIAVISAGKGNSYGHPSPETLARLKAAGADIYNTIEDGAVCVETDGKKIAVRTYK